MPRALARSPYTIIEAKRPDLMYRLAYQVQLSLMMRLASPQVSHRPFSPGVSSCQH